MRVNQTAFFNANQSLQTKTSENRLLTKLNNQYDSFNSKTTPKQISFGIEPVTTGLGILIWELICAAAISLAICAAGVALVGGGVYAVLAISDWVDNKRKAKAEALKIQMLNDKKAKVDANNGQISSKEAEKEYINELEKVTIPANGTGQEVGLNQVIGNELLKLGLARNLLLPLLQVMDGDSSAHDMLPNGICFFGPRGTGKSFIATALAGHYVEKGGCFKELEFVKDTEKDIATMEKMFGDAQKRFEKSGKTQYTIILLDEADKNARKEGMEFHDPVRNAKLLKLVNNCKDRGVIFISTSNKLSYITPDLLRNGRADMRIPIGSVDICDFADMVNFYIKQSNKTTDELDYAVITEAFKNKKLAYKPEDINQAVTMATRNIRKGYLSTEKLLKSIQAQDIIFDEAVQKQFDDEKIMARKFGGLNTNARYSDEDVVNQEG
ncbi:MAG: ATP-binding protein [Candidatus Gastranaerophilales bacterium]|nr:ATP-binding protein [Candidatus Gastranaerophilales bacterium]